ncbi:MAG: hypothetical protein HY026_00005, partial [Deltaproteobacteria bacterium]|nr:hypothetical protein [Deltaproteobacteria bacterium]
MKKIIRPLLVLALLATPFLSGCESQKLQQENADLKKQVEAITAEKTALESQV